jgi:hypothetical protein
VERRVHWHMRCQSLLGAECSNRKQISAQSLIDVTAREQTRWVYR